MMNPVVLTRLFELCDLLDLLEYRLVSKQWYAASLARIRNKVPLEITQQFKNSNINGLNWSTINTELSPDPEATPFRYFSISNVDLFPSPPPPVTKQKRCKTAAGKQRNLTIAKIHKNTKLFWCNYGQFIRKLKLVNCEIYCVEGLQKVIFEDTPNLDELTMQSLMMNKCDREAKVGENQVAVHSRLSSLTVSCLGYQLFPIPWQLLFLHFSKIQKLELDVKHADVIAPLVNTFESLDEIALNELHLKSIPKEQVASVKRLFQLPKLKLMKLRIQLNGGSYDADAEHGMFTVLMQLHGHKLKEFHGRSYSFSRFASHNGPIIKYFPFRPQTLDQLTHFCVTGFAFENYHFLEQTPNLIVLKFLSDILGETDWERLEKTRLSSLKTLHLNSLYAFSEGELETLVRVMPNVENFEGEIDKAELRVICTNWKKLRVLQMGWLICDDEAITGMQEGNEDRLPNITDLKDLRTISFDNDKSSNLGDSSIYSGFLKLKYLRSLSVAFSKLKTSQEAFDALVKQVPEGEIHTHDETETGGLPLMRMSNWACRRGWCHCRLFHQ